MFGGAFYTTVCPRCILFFLFANSEGTPVDADYSFFNYYDSSMQINLPKLEFHNKKTKKSRKRKEKKKTRRFVSSQVPEAARVSEALIGKYGISQYLHNHIL